MKKWTLIALILGLQIQVFGQFKKTSNVINDQSPRFESIGDVTNIKQDNPGIEINQDHSNFVFESMERTSLEIENLPNIQAVWTADRDIPLAIYGKINIDSTEDNIEEKTFIYLEKLKDYLKIDEVRSRFGIISIETDDLGLIHVRLKQYYMGIPIYGGELIVHFKNGNPYFLNGFWYPEIPRTSGQISIRSNINLKKIIKDDLGGISSFRNFNRFEQELMGNDQWSFEKVYFKKNEDEALKLYWRITVYPNIADRWIYFIEDISGRIAEKHTGVCKLHKHEFNSGVSSSPTPDGAEKAWATDLSGVSREIDVYNHNGSYYMMDASREMYDSGQSNMPDEPVGVIWTLDAKNTSPEANDFIVEHVGSSNNTWNDKNAVSAHYNSNRAYAYFKNTFGRNSINGKGGNIISLINIVNEDGSQMDNAFWSGKAMFYGNGKDSFEPLAGSLDVAGHEMTHGVIQSTANLEYYGEPGAINESFADVFGCMIDRDDWKLGEDVVFNHIFTSGALRDMSDPHNGGNSLNHTGYQPANVSEQYTGQEDNAGVHINSGIPNFAYYKFATSIGKDKAEQVYYKALTSYLTKSSRFVDLRVAIEQAAYDLYGANEKQAASNAFEAVGIAGGSGGGNNYQNDLEVNPGNDLVLFYDDINTNLVLGTGDGSIIQDPFSQTDILSKPSISDNGSEIVFVGTDRTIHYIYIDWSTGQYEESIIQTDTIWRNVIISKDGWRIAALTETLDNKIHIFDFNLNQWNTFEVYNPSTAEGVTAGAVDFVDMMEFNYSGEWIMYDSQNTINSDFGADIEYWDIGFIQVFNNNQGQFSHGMVQKLFSGLPENTSIGNPSFSKNSPYIIAFDYLIGEYSYYILGSNLETGDVSQLYESVGLGYPNYSRLDDKLIFNFDSFFGTDVAVLDVGESKIDYIVNSDKILYANAKWGSWFSNGNRDLVLSNSKVLKNISENIIISPNPAVDRIDIRSIDLSGDFQCQLINILGEVFYSNIIELSGKGYTLNLNGLNISNGTYFVVLKNEKKIVTKKLLIANSKF